MAFCACTAARITSSCSPPRRDRPESWRGGSPPRRAPRFPSSGRSSPRQVGLCSSCRTVLLAPWRDQDGIISNENGVDHRGLGLRRRSGNPGRPQDLRGARCFRNQRHHCPDGAEHRGSRRRVRDPARVRRPADRRSGDRYRGGCGKDGNALQPARSSKPLQT